MASPEIIVPKLGSFDVPLFQSPLQPDTSVCPPGSVTGEWISLEAGSSLCGTRGAFGAWAFLSTINQFGGSYPGASNNRPNIIPRQFLHWYLDETGIYSISALLKNPQQYGNYSIFGYPGDFTHGPGTIYFDAFDNGQPYFITGNTTVPNAYCDAILLKNIIGRITNKSSLRIGVTPDTVYPAPANLVLIDTDGSPHFYSSIINPETFSPYVYGWKTLSLEIPFPKGEFGTVGNNIFPIIRIGSDRTAYATYTPYIHGGLYAIESLIADPYSANALVVTDDQTNQWHAVNLRIPWGVAGGLGQPQPANDIFLSDIIDNADFQASFNGKHFAIPGGGFGINSTNTNNIYLIDRLFRGYYVYKLQPADGNASSAYNYGTVMDWNGNVWALNQHWDAATLYSSVGTHRVSPLLLFGSGAGLNLSSQVAFSECIPSLQRKRLW